MFGGDYIAAGRVAGRCVICVAGIAEMLTNAIGPAVAAKFFIYFLDIPHEVNWFGFQVPSFMLVVSIVLGMAVLVMWYGGRIALLITDCFQGNIFLSAQRLAFKFHCFCELMH